jgi:hypothetical protein
MALQKNWLRVGRDATDCGIVCELGVIRHISLMNKLSTAAVVASRNADADAAMNCCAMLLQGHTHMVELEGLREPHVAMHGSFSCMVSVTLCIFNILINIHLVIAPGKLHY